MLDHIEKIVACGDMAELWQLHAQTMAGFGFPRLIYGYTSHRSGRSLGDPQDILILTTLAPDYTAAFIDGGLYMNAPMIRWGLEHTGARSWRWIEQSARSDELDAAEQEVFAFNESHDFIAGYTLSFPSASHRTRAGIGLGAAPGVTHDEVDAIWAEHGREIWALNNVVHLKIITLPNTHARRPLTRRQREALEWVGEGKTSQDIATIMGLTPATVEKHLRLARDALGVETTAQAVLKASLQNQIFLIGTGD